MTAPTQLISPIGPTLALSVLASSHAAVQVLGFIPSNDVINYVAVINPSANPVAIKLSQNGTPATFPVDPTSGDLVLPPLMQDFVLLRLPNPAQGQTGPFVTAIAGVAGPSIIYVTPVTYQG